MDFIKEEDYQKFYEFCKEITYFEVDMSGNEESSGLTRYIVRYKRREIGILCLLELFLTEKIKYSESIQKQQSEEYMLSDYISIQSNEKIILKRRRT
ncbi:hypothetical protein [Cetobacterium sp.]|uniref:hypothetical protein n=1 Tax=Cetobacterium sp. TaxID=2071632 RepID=UPI003F30853A